MFLLKKMNRKDNFSLEISGEMSNNLNELFSISHRSYIIHFNSTKVLVLDNHRVVNLFHSQILTLDNFETNYYKYLNYGLVIIFDNHSITIYNDIYGAYPIYKNLAAGGLILSISNFIKTCDNSSLNKRAIAEFFHFNHFLGCNTLYSDIERIPGGCKLKIENKAVGIQQIITWDDILKRLTSFANENVNLYEPLLATIKESLNQNDNYLTLTGGFDSRLLYSTLLSKKVSFKNVTWGIAGNIQSEVARELSKDYGIEHINLPLDNAFTGNINRYLSYIFQNAGGSPFIVDVPQFIYMCESLPRGINLIGGFMGSEIIRGPSYSSQVTLTKFAADVCLSRNKDDVRKNVIDFQTRYPFIDGEFLNRNLDYFIDRYSGYAYFNNKTELRNYNIYKYLFYEKYAKIFTQFIKVHYSNNVNLISPFMDFNVIGTILRKTNFLNKYTPFENSAYKNYNLYRFYAKEIKNIYPDLLNSRMDRGYRVKDLLTWYGNLKLIPIQVERKKNKRTIIKNSIVVDSFSWFRPLLGTELISNNGLFDGVLNRKYLISRIEKQDYLDSLERTKILLFLGLDFFAKEGIKKVK